MTKHAALYNAFRMVMAEDLSVCHDRDIAVGVSGGADSLALCFLLSEYYQTYFPERTIHALSVDHGLRAEAAAEAEKVAELLAPLENVQHKTLVWQHEDGAPEARVQEQARGERYRLMGAYMQGVGAEHLFLAHHRDDQAETFLFRLAKGSGLDGLSCMHYLHERDDGLKLCRPLLDVPKDALIDFCEKRGIAYINDPSNDCDKFARVRLRQSMDVLEQEGLTAKRLAQTALRVRRAKDALDNIARKTYENTRKSEDTKRIVFNFNELKNNEKEVFLRVVLKGMSALREKSTYSPRMERVEALCDDLLCSDPFRKRTLGGVIFERKGDELILTREHDAA